MSDDYAASTATTGSVSVNSSSTGRIDFAGDYDWFRVTLVAGTTYKFRENGISLADAYLYLRDSSGNAITHDDDSGGNHNSLITYTPTTSGTYYLDAGGYHSNTGTYSVSVTASDDYANSTATTGSVGVNSSSTGRIDFAGDYDWFKVNLVAGTTYQLRENRISLGDSYLYFRDSSGTTIATDHNSGGGNNSLITFKPTTSGTYYLDAGGNSTTGTYTVSVTADDYANTTATTGSVGVNSSTTGKIDWSGDYDWFKVNLVAGTTYQLRENRISLGDSYLYFHNSSGATIATDHNSGGGNNSLITFKPTTSGTYYLDAGGNSTTGTYTVSVTADDYANTTATTGFVGVNSYTLGKIDWSGDYDWFKVNLVAGKTYLLKELGTDNLDPYLYLRNSSGAAITHDDNSGGNHDSLITYTATTSGVYYLDAGGYQNTTGRYAVTVYEIDITPPTVSSFSPADGSSGVAVGSNIVLNFSEAIQKGAGTIAIHSDSATGAVVESFNAASSGNLTVSGSALTINPTADLANNTHYYVTFTAGSVKDLAGNSYAGTSIYDFTTIPASVNTHIDPGYEAKIEGRETIGDVLVNNIFYPKETWTGLVKNPNGAGEIVDSRGGDPDPWGFFCNNCTSYVAYKIIPEHSLFSGKAATYFHSLGFGGAGLGWETTAQGLGWETSSLSKDGKSIEWHTGTRKEINTAHSPVKGDIAEWDFGHVAYVEKVNSDNTILISEYNWVHGEWDQRDHVSIIGVSHFIHIN